MNEIMIICGVLVLCAKIILVLISFMENIIVYIEI